jgi:NhaP-type Na+/H+ or K+/H+ antiporter
MALYKGILAFSCVLILYTTIGSWMEIKKFCVCHETGVIIVLGIGISLFLEKVDHETISIIGFSGTLFFDVLLPLIIFATGYNMRRKNFFENIMNIIKFGILGTVLTFIFYSLLFVILFEFDIEYYNPEDRIWYVPN